jgi:hypothetical protein
VVNRLPGIVSNRTPLARMIELIVPTIHSRDSHALHPP